MAMTVHRAGIRLTSGSEEGSSKRSNIRANSNDTPQPANADADEYAAEVSKPVADVGRSARHEPLMDLVEGSVRGSDRESKCRHAKNHTTRESSTAGAHPAHPTPRT